MDCVAELVGHKDRVWHVCWHPTLSLLASCGGDASIRLWAPSGSEWACVATLEQGGRTVRCCEWSPCGRMLAACSFDSKTTIWRKYNDDSKGGVLSFEAVATLEGHENEVKAVSWNAAGTLLASCSRDKNVWLWEAAVDSKPAAAGDVGDDDFECLSLLCGHTQDVKFVAWHPTKDEVFSCSYDDTIKVWREDAGDDWFCVETLDGHSSTVWGMSFEAGGKRFVSCSDDETLGVWAQDGAGRWGKTYSLAGYHTDTVFAVDWSPHHGTIASGAADDSVRLFTEVERSDDKAPPAFKQVLAVPKAHAGDVNHVRWHPREANLLASAGDDGLVKLWQFNPSGATDAGAGAGPP